MHSPSACCSSSKPQHSRHGLAGGPSTRSPGSPATVASNATRSRNRPCLGRRSRQSVRCSLPVPSAILVRTTWSFSCRIGPARLSRHREATIWRLLRGQPATTAPSYLRPFPVGRLQVHTASTSRRCAAHVSPNCPDQRRCCRTSPGSPTASGVTQPVMTPRWHSDSTCGGASCYAPVGEAHGIPVERAVRQS